MTGPFTFGSAARPADPTARVRP